ncbi:MAG: hypothetical protein K1000chlam2_00004 [Chlamydiae bacterium]|nr:hypothetical protein [Chlamydiota bacterium]
MVVSRQRANRPFKFGERDRRELIVQDSEVALRTINDTSGNAIFLGRAIAGVTVSEPKWQLRKIQYDSLNSVTSLTWAENDISNASTDYEFVWSTVSDLTITNITQASDAAVTVSSAGTLANGDLIVIQGVAGMTEVNFDGSNIYTVASLVGTTFELSGIDSTAFTAYSSAGTVVYGTVLQKTYS